MDQSKTGTEVGTNAARSLRKFISEALGWFGVVGGAFTLFSNISGFIQFASWVRDLIEHWNTLIRAVFTFLLQAIRIPVPEEWINTVTILTFLSTIVISSFLEGRARGSRHNPLKQLYSNVPNSLLFIFPAAVTSYFSLSLLDHFDNEFLNWTSLFLIGAIFILFLTLGGHQFVDRKLSKFAWYRSDHEESSFTILLVLAISMAAGGEVPPMRLAIGLWLFAVFLASFADPVILRRRCLRLVAIACSFVAVASLTLVPIPPGLTISNFFDWVPT